MKHDPREWTVKVLEAMDQGLLSAEAVAEMALGWLSDADVKQMLQANDLMDLLGDESRLDEDELETDYSSWEGDIDRQSGAFTQEEIMSSTAWR